MKKLFTPFETRLGKSNNYILLFWMFVVVCYWVIASSIGEVHTFPTVQSTISGITSLYQEGLITHIFSSFGLFFKAMIISILISLSFAYLSTLPLFTPVSKFITKLRFLPLTGLSFYLTLLITDARSLQVWILTIFTTTFLVTSLMSMINSIDEEEINHARSMGCNRWEILLQVIILGRIDHVIEIIRQNLSIIWMMLVTVESMLASVGGLGFLIKNSDKFMNHGRIMALQMIILLVGISIDQILTYLRKTFFRYTFK